MFGFFVDMRVWVMEDVLRELFYFRNIREFS